MSSSRSSLSLSLSLDRIKGLASAHGVSVDLFDGPEKERHEELDLSPTSARARFETMIRAAQCAHRLWPGMESPSLSSTPLVVPVAACLKEGRLGKMGRS